ncbi:MAG: YbaK/EbsC family protein [Nitrospirae bacterium]|nr:YbaK/EbsC family protein [Nitrospirota bacterium]
MAIVERVEAVLKKNNVIYNTIKHQEVYTAQEIAESMHVSGKNMAKVVMVKAKERYIMTVMPASCRMDFRKLKNILSETDLRLALEEEFKTIFPDCEAGAEPPFGNLYDIETYVDKSLAEDDQIYFNAGNHYEIVVMDYTDYDNIVRPKVAEFAEHLH